MLSNEELRTKSETRSKFFFVLLMIGDIIAAQVFNMNVGLKVNLDRAKHSAQLSHHVVPS